MNPFFTCKESRKLGRKNFKSPKKKKSFNRHIRRIIKQMLREKEFNDLPNRTSIPYTEE